MPMCTSFYANVMERGSVVNWAKVYSQKTSRLSHGPLVHVPILAARRTATVCTFFDNVFIPWVLQL